MSEQEREEFERTRRRLENQLENIQWEVCNEKRETTTLHEAAKRMRDQMEKILAKSSKESNCTNLTLGSNVQKEK